MSKRKDDGVHISPKKLKTHDIRRTPVTRLDSTADPLIFQQLELEHYVGKTYPGMPGAQLGFVPIMRMFGITENENSVCCHVHGFTPYLYVSLPDLFGEVDLCPFKEKLNNALKRDKDNFDPVLEIQIVQGKSLCDYNGDETSKFAKISVIQHSHVSAVKRILKTDRNLYHTTKDFLFEFFESNVDLETRFLVDSRIMGCVWIELPPGTWFMRDDQTTFPAVSRCQIEVDVSFSDLIAHKPEEQWAKVAPFRILSVDIECAGRKGIFPEPNIDPVIQIANIVKLHGAEEVFERNIFTLNTCASIGHAEIHSYQKESDMLDAWAEFVRQLDPDILTGYNINNFDFPYLLDRAKHLGLRRFAYLGRITESPSVIKEVTVQTKFGKRKFKNINFEGRVQYDMHVLIKRDFKLRSYTLNNVSNEIMGEQKEDVHYSIITDLQNGDDQTRRRLAIYCLKDAELPLKLLDHVKSLTNDIEMARVTGVPLTSLLNKGEQVKVVAQLLRHARSAGYFIPAHEYAPSSDQYEGATVLEPKTGYYKDPIATLDFSSLYPSIMIAHNLCYTTLIRPNKVNSVNLTKDQITNTPSGNHFVKASVRKGLLPQILEQLLVARKKAKTMLKDEKDPVYQAVLNGRQLALKISANSVYGFTGAQVGKLPCLEISGSVTAYGREMIELTRSLVEQEFCIEKGYSSNAEVIYGDTDSVMVNFKAKDLNTSMKLGKEAAEVISKKFISPIKLEFEKVYWPYLLINKKRYAGLYYTKTDTYDKMDCKGIETVRRDNCTLVVDVINTCLRKLLIDKDEKGTVSYVKQTISDLLQNNVDISQLVITKELTKNDEDYSAKQAHVELAKKLAKRDPGNAPKLGDRIPYVIICGPKNTPTFQRVEDPIYVLENNVPIDCSYYLENQLSKPLLRILGPVLGDNVESIILRGEHTRHRTKVTSKVGALAAFTQKKETCLGCRTVLKTEEEKEAVCQYCKPKEVNLYIQQLNHHKQLECRFSALFTECQRCQQSLHEEILCTSRDCPIFYIRKKVQMELESSKTKLNRFGDSMLADEDFEDCD